MLRGMLVLHLGVENSGFLLWGERPVETAIVPRKRAGRKSSTPRTVPLPYDAGADNLLTTLAQISPGIAGDQIPLESAIVWLPAVDGQPVASSSLIAEPPETISSASLARWQVTTLRIPIGLAIDLLCACVNKQTLAPGIVIGKDLAFWVTAMRLAGSLVARQKFLPDVVATAASGHAARARWEPVIAGSDVHRVVQLARAMPQVCRALTTEDVTSPPATPTTTLLSAFLSDVVDHLVRSTNTPPDQLKAFSRQKKTAGFNSIHDHWLAALRSDDGVILGEPSELSLLTQQVKEWRRPISISTTTPFRLCFRLEEPEASNLENEAQDNGNKSSRSRSIVDPESSKKWRVNYLLQAADDPSLLVPVTQAWKPKGPQSDILKRGAFKPREYLLSSLGQASTISPDIENSLRTSAPGGYDLDSAGTHEFLQEQAWLLEQSGFGVLLPSWWTRKGTKLRLTARASVKSPKMQGGSGLSLDEIVKFDWEIALGDQKLSLQELEMLARLKSPLVKVRGQWVQLSAEEIEAALNFWKKEAGGKAKVREVVQMALGIAKVPGDIAFEGVAATGWIGEFLAELQGRNDFEELPVPDEFKGSLRPYQLRGYSWLGFLRKWGLGACLADDMGLGKTPQTLALIQQDWLTNGQRPTLVVCPMSVVGNWQKEAERFTPNLPVMVHHGLTRAKGPAFKKEAQKHALVLSSFSLLHRDFGILKEVEWSGIILDEAQNIKNPQTKQAQAARTLPADYRIALTGTPVENNVGDLWSIMEFLNPGFLGTQAEFKRNFFLPIQTTHDPEATRRLKRLTGPFILRRLKTDKKIIADLPEKMEMKVFCTLTKEQASLYAAVVDDASNALDESTGIRRKGIVLATLSKLKQVCNHPAQFLGDNSAIPGRSGKLARLTEMLEEVISAGDRALIFTQFSEMGEIVRKHLQETYGRVVVFVHRLN
jgi:SNF2 family DNA or RNA helicase